MRVAVTIVLPSCRVAPRIGKLGAFRGVNYYDPRPRGTLRSIARSIAPISFAAIIAVGIVSTLLTTVSGPRYAAVRVDYGVPQGVSQLSVGVTHGQYSLDSWGNTEAITRGEALLRQSATYQNQHLMGWGANNPEPSPGVYDWGSLDRRIALIRRTGGTPVITLCCAPDWMKGGEAGKTDWSRLEVAPTPEHYADFAALAQQVAQRYPDVKHYQVWNELKGFWDAGRNRWDYEGYTTLYNLVYDALKVINPIIQVGGPYVVFDSWGCDRCMSDPSAVSGAYGTLDQRPLDVLTYWLDHKHGADFVAIDASTRNWDEKDIVDPLAAAQKFADILAWVKQRTNLPIWFAEWYAPASNPAQHEAAMALSFIQIAQAGGAVALSWEPQGTATASPSGDFNSIWGDTQSPNGGQSFPFYSVQRALRDSFGPGTILYRTAASSADVAVLASADAVLVVNTRPNAITVRLNGAKITLNGYGVYVSSQGH